MTLTTSQNEQIINAVQRNKRKRPDRTEDLIPHTKPGEISRMLAQAVEISSWPDIDTDDADQVSDRFRKYHQFCIDHDIKPDMPGLALSIGVTRKTLWAWENGYESNKPQAVRNVIKKAREINEIMMTQMMANGKINPVAGIFFLKNSHQYTDTQDIVITPNVPYQSSENTDVDKLVQALPDTTDE